MPLEPAIPPNNRSIGEATEADAKLALSHIDETCEWTFWEPAQLYIVSYRTMVIARIEGLGAGFLYTAWALKYDNVFKMQRDWLEIQSVPAAIVESRKRRHGK